MIRPPPYDPDAPVVVVDIGNTRTSVATWHLGSLKTPLTAPTAETAAVVENVAAHFQSAAPKKPAAMVISAVVPDALAALREQAASRLQRDALVVGDTIPLPIDVDVTDRRAVGADRVCAAAAAFDRLQVGCTVVCFGTAITVDLVDDDGTFVGGAILPGLRMQLRALNEFTAKLPLVEPAFPELPYGRNTAEAIQNGVSRGLAGAVRGVVESYATYLNHWPQVVASGGDAEFMAPHCDFIDTFTSNLVLRGVGLAYSKFLGEHGA